MLRVLGGSAKGRTLKMPGGGKTRPAMSRVKESLFSILMNRLEGARILDLFAGSGSVGIEALSRGGVFGAFVDTASECVQTIRANLEKTELSDRARVYRDDCLKFIKTRTFDPFDLVFIDPPYLKGLLEPILAALPGSGLFHARTLFIIERQKKDDLTLAQRPALELIDERNYGDTVLTIFKLRAAPESLTGESVSQPESDLPGRE
jgi:16S rRNA (guanine(966)-N(2))-methyltransferase RsmD